MRIREDPSSIFEGVHCLPAFLFSSLKSASLEFLDEAPQFDAFVGDLASRKPLVMEIVPVLALVFLECKVKSMSPGA